jgi:hypothetical protein
MKKDSKNKFKEWFKNQTEEDLKEVALMLNHEFNKRGYKYYLQKPCDNVEEDEGVISTKTHSVSKMSRHMTERFTHDLDSGSGIWC